MGFLFYLSIPWWNGMVTNWKKSGKLGWSRDWHRLGLLDRGLFMLIMLAFAAPDDWGWVSIAMNPLVLYGDISGPVLTGLVLLWLGSYGYDWIIAKMMRVRRWMHYKRVGVERGFLESGFMFASLGAIIFCLLVFGLYGERIGW